MPDFDTAMQILGGALSAPPPDARTALGYRATSVAPASPDEIIANAKQLGGYVPSMDEAKAMSADLAARQPAPPSLPPPQFPEHGGAPVPVEAAEPVDPFAQKLAILQAGSRGKLPPAPATPKDAGVVANLAAGATEALTGIAGAPVDATAWLLRNRMTGFGTVDPDKMSPDQRALYGGLQHPVGGSTWLNARLGDVGKLTGGWFGGNPEDIPAGSTGSRIARAAGAGAMSMVAPYAGARALGFAGDVAAARTVPEAVGETFAGGSAAGNAAIGASAGITGQAAAEAVPDEYKPYANFVGQLLGGVVTGGSLALARSAWRSALDFGRGFVRPFNIGTKETLGTDANGQPIQATAGQQYLAGQRLLEASSNPGALRGALDEATDNPELVPGSAPTTYQLTGDQGLGQLERAQATKNPDLFNARRAEQNAARVAAIETIAPEGSPAAFGDFVKSQLATIDARNDAMVSAAQRRAGEASANLGGRGTAQEYGAIMRAALVDANNAAKAEEHRLWQAIDPRGDLAIDVTAARDAAKKIYGGIGEYSKPAAGEEARILGKMMRAPQVMKFADLTDLRGDLLAAIRQERAAPGGGDTRSLARMQQLRQSIDNVIAGAGQEAQAQQVSQAAPVQPAGAPQVGASVYTPSGRAVGVRYEVVPGASLVPSHGQDLNANPRFPPELQPRERSRLASGTQIAGMAQNLQPERLGPSASAAEGAPIVGPDGVVESGNARTLAILRAYEQGGKSAQAYRDYLASQGFNTEGIENPVLIRRRVSELTPADRIRFAQEANAGPGLALSATERAGIDAERMPASVLDLYKGGDVTSAENRAFVRGFLQSVPEQTELGALVTPEGQLSLEGAARIRNALLAKAYGDADLVGSLAETGDPNIKAFGGALSSAAGDIARLNGEIRAGRVPDRFDITGPILQAAALVQRARASRVPLADVVAQRDAFASVSPLAEQILRDAYGADLRGRLSQVKFADLLRFYADEAGKQTAAAGLFGENTVTPADILAAGARKYGRAYQSAEPSLLAPGRDVGLGQSAGARGDEARGPRYGQTGQEAAAGEASGPAAAGAAQSRLVANVGPEHAAAYRAAANATRERKATFGTGLNPGNPVAATLRPGYSAGTFRLVESQVPAKFFNSGSHAAEDVAAYIKAAGGREGAIDALQDYAAMSLRRAAERSDGTLDPAEVNAWIARHQDALRAFPELAQKFRNAGAAQAAVDEAAAMRVAGLRARERYAAAKFVGADPIAAVGAAFRTRNAAGEFAKLVRWASMDKSGQALAGLRRAVVEYMQGKLIGAEEAGGFIKAAQFGKFIRENRAALSIVFPGRRLRSLEAIAEDLRRSNPAATKLRASPGTAQDLTAVAKHAAASGAGGHDNLFSYLIALGLEHHTGSLIGGLGGAVGIRVAQAMRNAGLRNVDHLVTEAMLDPELARTLLMKVTPQSRAMILKRLASQLETLAMVEAPADEKRRRTGT